MIANISYPPDTESEKEDEDDQVNTLSQEVEGKEEQESGSDSGMEGTVEEDLADGGEITTVQLLAARRDRLQHDKLRIGALCSSLLESPEKKVMDIPFLIIIPSL